MEDNLFEDNVSAPAETVDAPIVEEAKAEPEVVQEAPAVSEQEVIGSNSFAASQAEVQAVGSVADGAIGVTSAPRAPKPASKKKKNDAKETVAIHSQKNVSWPGVGKVAKGYNIVDADTADKWLEKSYVRLATPQEVAKEFGR